MTGKATPNSSIEELEGERWPEPDFDSHLVRECHRLRKLQLRLFTVENLRIMLGQDIGSRYLVPIALEHLEADPLVAGDFYPGDLLCSVLSLPREFWRANPELRTRVAAVAGRAIDFAMGENPDGGIPAKAIRKGYDQFVANG
ncbi:MAG TPA: contact-dependent growth inhibition system immunity protein [Burkholderiales bacterium]|nr:contact-dependent growth inhibition system immunity protein [Burkholderiales bacterium]